MTDNLFSKIKSLLFLSDVLIENIYKIHFANEHMLEHVDTIAIEDRGDFKVWQRKIYNDILSYEEKSLDEYKLYKIFDIKKKRLIYHIDNLSENTIGTSLNMATEFYANVLSDLRRNIKE